jgi:hypothetical protein
MDEIEFIQVELTSEIYNLKIKELVKVLLEVDDELQSKQDQEILGQKDAA